MTDHTDWTNNKMFRGLLRRATRIAREFSEVQGELTEAFNERYGCTYSDIDADQLIDTLDYGTCLQPPTVAQVDIEMRNSGAGTYRSRDYR